MTYWVRARLNKLAQSGIRSLIWFMYVRVEKLTWDGAELGWTIHDIVAIL